jgi:uncharacterized protein
VLIGIVGSYTGKKIVNQIPQDIFKKVVLVAIALASLLLIYNGTYLLY